MQKNEIVHTISTEAELTECLFPLVPGDIVFFFGDLGAGKTTYIRVLLRAHFQNDALIIRSPTYTYYQEYRGDAPSVHHFDLYRLDSPETFYMIGGAEILENPKSIALIEWPEILGDTVQPTKTVHISYDSLQQQRIIRITEKSAEKNLTSQEK